MRVFTKEELVINLEKARQARVVMAANREALSDDAFSDKVREMCMEAIEDRVYCRSG